MEQIALNIDCMEYMKKVPDKYFDLAIVDPPYGIGIFSMNYTGGEAAGKAKRRDYRTIKDWDIKPGIEYFNELFRVSKKQIVWGGNYFSDYLHPSKSFIIWDKRETDIFKNDYADCEYAWMTPGMGVARIFRFLYNGMIQHDMKNKEDRFHPTQKPVALYEWILNRYAKDGYKIFDSHMGSGSSRIACYRLGFEYVGCEIDKEYFEKQEERFKKESEMMRLF